MRWGFVVVSVALVGLATQAGAGVTLERYQQARSATDKQVRTLIDSYVAGIGNGLVASSSYFKINTGQPLFCFPKGVVLNTYNFQAILDKAARSGRYRRSHPISAVLTLEFGRLFACTSRKGRPQR